jgi:gamma-glutamylcyclotransferase
LKRRQQNGEGRRHPGEEVTEVFRSDAIMTSDIWYFAYGSNLTMDRKRQRTGLIRSARTACLKGYRLAFNKGGAGGEVYANIVPSPDDVVWGVVYLCDPQAMASLDDDEAVERGDYWRHAVDVETTDGELVKAEVYVAGEDFLIAEGRPRPWYLDLILLGARKHGLPEEYIKSIEELAR